MKKTEIHSIETLNTALQRDDRKISEVGRSFGIPESLLSDNTNIKPLGRRPLLRPKT